MILGIQYLYSNYPLPGYLRKGWREHYEKMGLGPMKVSACVERKMKSGKIPPHLKGTKIKVVCVDERPKRHYYIAL